MKVQMGGRRVTRMAHLSEDIPGHHILASRDPNRVFLKMGEQCEHIFFTFHDDVVSENWLKVPVLSPDPLLFQIEGEAILDQRSKGR